MSQRKMADHRKIEGAVDSISNLPDVILQHILCYIPTKLAISTSLLSRRWRHVWCDIPSLSLYVNTLTAASVNETLTRYTAPNQWRTHSHYTENIPYINLWIKCAMSHNVENLSLQIWNQYYEYKLPDFFCNSSSLSNSTSLLIQLFLSSAILSNESMAKILSGCPVLKKLKLYYCCKLKVLDLSKSLSLRTLEVNSVKVAGPTQIVAPNIHCLRLFNSQLSYPLPDVASLTEAELEICFVSMDSQFEADFLQVWVLEMLEKLQNADKLNFGRNFVQILSIAEIRGAHFPLLKVKAMTLDTKIFQYVIPGIERLLQR
ncbi:putative F-box/LRR-repeat protein At3g18150 [Brassica napus]|uniref:putative F-box/LRR-repeat protein At3g18150 n=1 Tax=Brassica napus TaxID=3708 RepID=UPI002078861B|nr:putative F-box/LRR-repeat protein At3g18150 [Brassica napus]